MHSLFSILPSVKLFCIYLSPRVGIIGPQGYSLYEQRFSLSSQITQSLRSQSVYIKTVYSVVQIFTTTYKYEAKILKDNLC